MRRGESVEVGGHQKAGVLSEALCRTPVIVWLPDQNHFVSQSAEKPDD